MNWDSIPLRDVLQFTKDYVPVHAQALYRYAALRPYPNGLSLVGEKKGADFRGKQHQTIHAGQFVISRTRIQQHYWGVVQPELDAAIVHRNTVCFELHPKLNPDYFAAYLATPLFSQAASDARTKQGRLDVRRFVRIALPFPSLDDQSRIAEVWQYAHKALKGTVEMQRGITEIKTAIAADLFRKADSSSQPKYLGEYVAIGRDASVDYPLYLATDGKVIRTSTSLAESIGLLPNTELDPYFLQYFLEHQKHKWRSPAGNTVQSLELSLHTLQIPVPSLYVQRQTVALLQQHDDVLHKLKVEQHELRHLTQGIIQQIFTGTLPLQEAIALFHTL